MFREESHGWKVEDVIYEVALKEGYGLNCCVECVAAVEANNIHRLTDPGKEQSFLIYWRTALTWSI